jgi:hypothetical protein
VFAHDTFTSIFGAVRPGELEVLTGLIRAALRAGYAVVLNEPGTKKPLCPLTAATRRKADREAQDAAASAGNPAAMKIRHACGVHHALTEDDVGKVTGLVTRLTKEFGGTPNIGLEPGRSRLLAVDVDTATERDAFLADWAIEMGDEAPPTYTVRSPGVMREDGTWVHSEGGHFWFTLPDAVTLPGVDGEDGIPGVLKADGGWTVVWAGRQVLVPPSVRPEGPYACVGSPQPAPAFLTDRIFRHAEGRRERERIRLAQQAERRSSGVVDPVDAWSEDTPWSTLLEPRGWVATGLVDTCSCPTWTAPGPHGSPKSATAHDIGCTRFDTDDGHAPLHVWTDNPPDYLAGAPRTLTKLTHEAYADHEGSESEAVSALGLAVHEGGAMVVDNPFDLGPAATSPVQELSTPDPHPVDSSDHEQVTDEAEPWDTPADATYEETTPPSPTTEKPRTGTLAVYDSADLDDLPDPDPLIYGLLDRGSLAILSGKFGTYKSFLALDWAAHIATGRDWEGHPVDEATPAVYIAAEGQVGIKRRVRGWRRRHLAGEHLPRGALTVIPQRVVLETDKAGKATAHLVELVALVNELGAGLVVFDTLSKSKGKADENSNSEMSAIMALVIELTRATSATVLLVAHTGYSGEHTRGGSSQEDDADTVFVVKFEDPKSEDRSPANRRVLHHRKSKDGDLAAPMVLTPHVEELGVDNHGRPVTTLTLTTDPFTAAPEVAKTVTVESVLDELERLNAPRGLTQRGIKKWVAEQDLPESSHIRVRFNSWWPVYYGEYSASDSQTRESDDHGITPDQEE